LTDLIDVHVEQLDSFTGTNHLVIFWTYA